MFRRILLAVSTAAVVSACASHHQRVAALRQAVAPSAGPGEAVFLEAPSPHRGQSFTTYLIDPLSRTCTLVAYPHGWNSDQSSIIAVPIDCATLAANYPDAAAIIFWVTPAAVPPAPNAPLAPPAG
jgi:hypothetical protein